MLLSDAGVCWTPGHDKGLRYPYFIAYCCCPKVEHILFFSFGSKSDLLLGTYMPSWFLLFSCSLSGLVVDLGSLKSLSGNVSYLQKFEGLEILLQRKSGKFF